MQGVKTRADMARSELDTKQKRLATLSDEYKSKWATGDYNSLVRQTEEDIARLQRSLSVAQSGADVYHELTEKAKSTKCCPLCSHNLGQDGELKKLLKKVSEIISNLPQETGDIQNQLDDLMRTKRALSEFQPKFTEMERLKGSEIQTLSNKLRAADMEYDAASVDVDDAVGEVALMKSETDEVRSLQDKVDSITRMQEEINTLGQDITQLEQELSAEGSGKTLEDVQSELDGLQAKEKEIRTNIERINGQMKLRQNDVIKKEKAVNDLAMEVLKLEHRLGDIDRLHQQRDSLSKENQQIDKDMESILGQIREIEPQVAQLESERAQIVAEARSNEIELDKKLSEVRQTKLSIDGLMSEIKSFQRQNIDSELKNLDVQVEQLNSRLQETQRLATKYADEINGMSQKLSEIQVLERNIQDNFQYRRIQKEVSTKVTEISELERNRGSFDVSAHQSLMKRLKEEQEKASAERAGLQGEVRQLEIQKTQLERELDTDYKDIEEKYRSQLIKLKTLELANTDLETYAKALDR